MARSIQITAVMFFSILALLGIMAVFAGPPAPEMKPVRSTIITPHPDTKITPGENLLYCATFQVAWNQLQDRIIQEPLRLSGNPKEANLLNNQHVTAGDLPANAYLAKADKLTRDFLDRLNTELRTKFGKNAPPTVKEAILPNTFLSYAFLYKNIDFPNEFEMLDDPVRFSPRSKEPTPVEGFGLNHCRRNDLHQHLRQQVFVLDYQNDNDFILRLAGKDPDDLLILAKVRPQSSLLQTIQTIEERIEKNAQKVTHLLEDECLQIPKITLKMDVSYPQFKGAQFLNKNWEAWRIGDARQWVRFKLDQNGAAVKSEARIIIIRGALRPVRNFIFNKPFLLYMKKKNRPLPYFALWLETPDWFQASK